MPQSPANPPSALGTHVAIQLATMSVMPGRDDRTPAGSGVKLTYDDYVLFPEDGKRHELIDGERFLTPSPNTKHQTIAINLAGMIWSHLQQQPIGRVFTAPFDVVFSDFDVVERDLLYLSTERGASVLTPNTCEGLPISSWKSVLKVRGGGTRRSNAGFTNDSACPNTGSSILSSTRSRCTAESATATSELPSCPSRTGTC